MITEKEFLNEISKIVLGTIKSHEFFLTKQEVCRCGHFSPKMLRLERLLSMRASSFMRMMLLLATTMNEREFEHFCQRISRYILQVAEDSELSAYSIIDNHAGSPVKKRCDEGSLSS